MKTWRSIGIAAILALGLAACGGGNGGGGTDTGTTMAGKATCAAQTGSGVLCTKAVAADGVTPLVGAEIRIGGANANEAAKLASLGAKGVENADKCLTDDEGNAACVVPEASIGAQSFCIIFEGYANKCFDATTADGTTTDAGTQSMTGDASAKWAVVPGAFDGVQVLLAQLKNCTLLNASGESFDPATENAADARWSQDCEDKGLLILEDIDTASPRYVPTFLASEAFSGYSALFINCAADFSATEGVNATIQAFNAAGNHIYFSDLADSWLTSAFPDKIVFGETGTDVGTVSAGVVQAGLADYVGNTIDVVFDLGGWADIDTVATGVTTFIQGDISALSGLTGTHPITVGWRQATSSGCVFYTSYHIEGASSGSNQEKAIKYLVQNIASVCQ